VLSIARIYLTDIPSLNYEKHLFEEREIRSVTANKPHGSCNGTDQI